MSRTAIWNRCLTTGRNNKRALIFESIDNAIYNTAVNKRKNVKQYLYRPNTSPEGSRSWGSQITRQSAHESGKVVSPTHPLPLPSRKYSWYSLLFENSRPSMPLYARKDYVNDKFQLHHRNWTRDFPACSAVSQPTATPRAARKLKGYWKKYFPFSKTASLCFW